MCVCVCVCVSAVLCVHMHRVYAPSIMTSVYFRLLCAIIIPLRASLTFVQLTMVSRCYINPRSYQFQVMYVQGIVHWA